MGTNLPDSWSLEENAHKKYIKKIWRKAHAEQVHNGLWF